MPAEPRILIRGGLLVDGTGAAPRRADLTIEGDRITGVLSPGSGPREPGSTIEAAGLVVCPGFIDIHSHGDLIVTLPRDEQRRLVAGRIGQGITTEIVGNCGLGVFPCDRSIPLLRAVAGWMTPPGEMDWPSGRWRDLASYLSHLESNGIWSNVGALQPHGPLRMEAAGLGREAGPEAEAQMIRQLDEALDAGAFGMSTGLIYPPGIYTATGEIVRLSKAIARRCGNAFVASHIRGSSETLLPAVEELLTVGREAGIRVQHSHSEAVGRDHWGKIEQVLSREEAARRSGIAVAFDMFPYTAAATMMFAIYPPWSLEGGVDRLLERLKDPTARTAIEDSIRTVTPGWPPWTEDGWPHNLVKAVGWGEIRIGSVVSEANRPLEGSTLEELGRRRGRSPFDAVSDLMIEERGLVSQIIHGISGDEAHREPLEMLVRHPSGAICTDANDFGKGKPHPASHGAFPLILGRHVRERRLLSLEEAVRKMTGYPASLLGLKDRGVVRENAFADLVVLDPDRIGSAATYDDPRRSAEGIRCVMINGTVVAGGATAPGKSPPGRVLRRPSSA